MPQPPPTDTPSSDVITSRPGRGRNARRPRHIPWKGWKDILRRTYDELGDDNLGVVAAGVAFYTMLSIFPLLGAAVATYGLFTDRVTAEEHISRLYTYLPDSAASTISERVHTLVETDGRTLSFGLFTSLFFALFSGSRGVDALFTGIHIAYDEQRSRPWWQQRLLAAGLTILGFFGGILSLFLVAGAPSLFDWLHLGGAKRIVGEIFRFVLLLAGMSVGLAVLYRYGPKRARAKWRWLAPGAVGASVLWLLGSYGFSFYVARWGSYQSSYGAVGGVVVLMIWMWISAFAVLLGAELNAEVEAQTRYDTTEGSAKPMGSRNAVKADVLGTLAADSSSFDEDDAQPADGDAHVRL